MPNNICQEKSKPLPAYLKNEVPKSTQKFLLISRIADAETRAQLEIDDNWDQKIEFTDEKFAQGEYDWLTRHSNMREFKLIKVITEVVDDLDDDIPWDDMALGGMI